MEQIEGERDKKDVEKNRMWQISLAEDHLFFELI